MADRRLELTATLKNQVSPQLKQIGRDMKEVRQTPGMEQVRKWFSGFTSEAESFVKGGAGIAGMMTGVGAGGLAAAAGLSELAKQFKDLGDHAFAMKRLGQETGLTLDQISRWEYVGQTFRVPVEQMDGALKTLGDQMVDFKRRRGELFGQLNQAFPKLAEKLGLEDTQHQLQDIFAFLEQFKNAAERNRWAKAFFGSEDLDALLVNGMPALLQAMDQAKTKALQITPEFTKQADELNRATLDFNSAVTNLELKAGPAVVGGMRYVLEDFTKLFDQVDRLGQWWDKVKGHPADMWKDVATWQTQGAMNELVPAHADELRAWMAKKGLLAPEDAPANAADLEAIMRSTYGQDGNALHRNDVPDVDWLARQKAIENAFPKPPSPVLTPDAPPASATTSSPPAPAAPAPAPSEHHWWQLWKRTAYEDGDRTEDLRRNIDPQSGLESGGADLRRNIDFRPDTEEGGRASSSTSTDVGLNVGLEAVIATGTMTGMLAAFREWSQEQQLEQQPGGGGGAGGLTKASLEEWHVGGFGAGAAGGGAGGGDDSSPPARGLYDAIAQAEGTTKDGFNTVLGYGKWGKPQGNLTDMTLDQVRDFGLQMRKAQKASGMAWDATSSASGKFQIVGTTMMAAAKALGMDPHTQHFDGPTQERMAAWIAKTQGLGAWEGFKTHGAQLQAAREALRTGDLSGASAAAGQDSGGDAGAGAKAVDLASKLHGASRSAAARQLGASLTPGEWCADFVNGALKAAGSKGVNSHIANAFLGWGKEVSAEAARKGDVAVEDRGRGLGNPGGHAGLFTGNKRMRNGREQLEVASGNFDDSVNAHDWIDAAKLHIRRALPDLEAEARKANEAAAGAKNDGSVEAHIHLHQDGRVRGGSVKGTGATSNPKLFLKRGPTMTEPSYQA